MLSNDLKELSVSSGPSTSLKKHTNHNNNNNNNSHGSSNTTLALDKRKR
jgi:hypothetical protein